MSSDILAIDTFRSNAYSEDVKFDLQHKKLPHPDDLVTGSTDVQPSDELEKTFDPEISLKKNPPKQWELDVRALISTKKWLQNYGLKKNKLDIRQLLPNIGFKHCDEYDIALKKPICSRYGLSLFDKFMRADGKSFNISCTKDKLKQIESRLVQAIHLYKRRLEWLTTESRRIIGVIEERAVSIVLDIKNMSPQQFDQYRAAVERVLREQVSQLAKFNLIRAAEDLVMYSPECVPVTHDSVDKAVEWMWNLDRLAPVSRTASCEAVTAALADPQVEAIYLFTEGCSSDGARELFKEKLTGASIPVHVTSYNCTSAETIRFLKELTRITGARFHAYAVVMEMDCYEGLPVDPHSHQANIILKKKTYGGVPPGAGMRDDVIELFEELEEARNTLTQVVALTDGVIDSSSEQALSDKPAENLERSEQYMSSQEWLAHHGLRGKKLGLYDILAGVAFKHIDGVVDIREAPLGDDLQTDAKTRQKLLNAKYCEKFPVISWKDGQVVHVQVTPEMHRNYETKMASTLEKIQQRIDWLQQGSRELFGTVIEDQIYILVDTSSSMVPNIQFVKDKLFVLMQEQLRHKQKFNLIGFDSKASSWRDRMVEVNELNLQSAWSWIKGLSCKGSTNTLSALKIALADPQTEAVYLLSDGRPDHPPKTILAQCLVRPNVPVHTISFNCADREANEFLCQLAKDTSGRFHYYSENGVDPEGPEPWESEDIQMLKKELLEGFSNLEKIAQLRDECAALAWKKETNTFCSRDHMFSERVSAVPALDTDKLYRDFRPRSAPSPRVQVNHYRHMTTEPSHQRPRSAHSYQPNRSQRSPRLTRRGRTSKAELSRSDNCSPDTSRSNRLISGRNSARFSIAKPLIAGHTKTSLLRTMSSSGHFSDQEWLLPETRELFDKQNLREHKLREDEDKKIKKRQKKKKKVNDPNCMSSKRWLTKFGLSVQKLTIVDALAPTMITHKPKYVPILDKKVLSRVFDEIMPYAHASGDRKHVRLVNPNGVDLEAYEQKLNKAIIRYNRRLDSIVWKALPENEKEQFESDEPVSFCEHRHSLMRALDECGWPVSERDIQLLEKEIQQAEKYLQQSKELRNASQEQSEAESEKADESGGDEVTSNKNDDDPQEVSDAYDP